MVLGAWNLENRRGDIAVEGEFGVGVVVTKGQVYGLSKNEITALLSEIGFKIILHNKFMLGINNLIVVKKQKNNE